MKTKIRTFIGLVALGMIGFTNIYATAGIKEMNAFLTEETEESLGIEEWMLDSDLWIEKTEAKSEVNETERALEVESWMMDEDFFKAAESFTANGADEEIEKYATRQVALAGERNSK